MHIITPTGDIQEDLLQ